MPVLSDATDTPWLWLESVSGAGVSGERAGEPTLLYGHHGSSAEGTHAERTAKNQEIDRLKVMLMHTVPTSCTTNTAVARIVGTPGIRAGR